MFSAARDHAIARIRNTAVRREPFPHVCVESVFPPSFYDAIQAHRLPDGRFRRLIDTGRVSERYSPARLCVFPEYLEDVDSGDESGAFWRALFAALNDPSFCRVWFEVFGPDILQHFQEDLPDKIQNGGLQVRNEVLLMRDLERYALGPHTDSPAKVVSVLFYLPADDGRIELGTSLYRPKRPDFTCPGGPHHGFEGFERVATLPYKPNTLVAFPKTRRSFHGVEPVRGADAQRELILFDLKVR